MLSLQVGSQFERAAEIVQRTRRWCTAVGLLPPAMRAASVSVGWCGTTAIAFGACVCRCGYPEPEPTPLKAVSLVWSADGAVLGGLIPEMRRWQKLCSPEAKALPSRPELGVIARLDDY